MNEILNIFGSDAFSLVTLTNSINKVPFVPYQVGNLGIFEERGIATTHVAVEEYQGVVKLVPDTPRGAPPVQSQPVKRKMRSFRVPHFPLEDTINVGEVQNVREFGGGALSGIEAIRDRKLTVMARSLDATVEYGRIGAITGKLLDSDGSTVLYNWFTEFGLTQDSVDFALGTAGTDILGKTLDVANKIELQLGAPAYDKIMVIAGKTWYQKFITHASVKTAYQYFQQTNQTLNPLRQDLRYTPFEFGALSVVQYRGVVGGVTFVADSEAYAFPVGVPEQFLTYFAPADYIETANTIGLPRYAKAFQDSRDKYIGLETQTNALSLNSRPETSIKLTTSN